MQVPIGLTPVRHRLPAVIALLPICAMAWLLIFHVPVGRRSHLRYISEATLEGNSVVRTERLKWIPRRVAIDLESGKSTILPRKTELYSYATYLQAIYYTYSERVNSRGDVARLRQERNSQQGEILVHVQDADGSVRVDNQSVRCADMPILVGDDYLVSSDNLQLEIRDLRNINNLVTHSISPSANDDLQAIDGYSRFVRHASSNSSTAERVELYEVIDARPRLLTSWPVEPNMHSISRQGKIYNWKPVSPVQSPGALVTAPQPPAQPTVEVRDASGHITKSIELPKPFIFGTGLLGFRRDIVLLVDYTANSIRYYDPLYEREIKLPKGCTLTVRDSAFDNGKLHFSGTYDLTTDQYVEPCRFVTYNRKSGQIETDLHLDAPFNYFTELDSGNPLLISSAYGYSVMEVSEDGSEIVRTHAPYAWAGWMMPLTALLFAAWSTYWVRCSIQDGGWTWIDCLLIGGLPLVCIWQRMHAVESHLLMLIYEVGLYVGVLSLVTAWLVFGRTRASLRFLVVAVLVSLGLHFGLAVPRDEQVEAPVIFFTFATATGMCAFGSILRFAGLTCLNETQPPADTPRPRITIAGYFWATIGIALLTVEARSVTQIRMTGDMAELGILAIVGGTCGLLMLIAALLALCRKPSIHYCTGALCGLVAAAAVALPWSIFVYGARFSPPAAATNWGLVPAALTIPFATTFILFLPYRTRGWRIAWRPGN